MKLEKKVYSERSEIDLCTMLVMMFDYSVENLYPDLLAFLEENWGEDSKHTIWEGFLYLIFCLVARIFWPAHQSSKIRSSG